MSQLIYLDHAAATPLHPEVLEAMLPYLKDNFANPSANFYKSARTSRQAVENARKTIAKIIESGGEEIIFTAGGTESCNLAVLGYCRKNKTAKKNHIITSKIEHHAVLNAFEHLEKHEGFSVTYLDCNEYGIVDPETFEKAIRSETLFFSLIYANNEIGTIQDIAKFGKICQRHGIVFHTDACQAGGLDLNVRNLGADMITLNGSKIYGPKGTGILFKKRDIDLEPLIYGGGQEYGFRPGTENISGIIGFSRALELIQNEKTQENERLKMLSDEFLNNLLKKTTGIRLNGHPSKRLPGNLSLTIEGINTDALLLKLDEKNICASAGSACAASMHGLSHVILAIGVPDTSNTGVLRLTLGKSTTTKDMEIVSEVLPGIVAEIRSLSF